jgi:hypothetical protein
MKPTNVKPVVKPKGKKQKSLISDKEIELHLHLTKEWKNSVNFNNKELYEGLNDHVRNVYAREFDYDKLIF